MNKQDCFEIHHMEEIEVYERYDDFTAETSQYPGKGDLQGLLYVALGLAGEAGEFANKVKKILRDHNGQVTEDVRDKLVGELGDVLWYVSRAAQELGTSLFYVKHHNVEKLRSRRERNTISGTGDDR